MTLHKECKLSPVTKRSTNAKHNNNNGKVKRSVQFSVSAAPELVVRDAFLQSTDKRRKYMRRGSRCPSMLAIHAVRSSAEVAQLEAHDLQQEKLEQRQQTRCFLSHAIRRCSFPLHQQQQPGVAAEGTYSNEAVNHDLARSLFHKTNLTNAQKRRLSLEILSRVQQEANDLVAEASTAATLASL